MVSKADFTAEEWKQVLNAPQMAALYVALASPSGLTGVVAESIAPTKLIVKAMKEGSSNGLITAVAADFKEIVEKREKAEPPKMSMDPIAMKADCLQACRDLGALLAQKAPAEAEDYKQWVYQAAQQSADAAKEGGFLGFGGVQVSEAEVTALKEIASALAITV